MTLTLECAKDSTEQYRQKYKDRFEIPSLEKKDSVLNVLNPAISATKVPHMDEVDNAAGAVLDVDDEEKLEGSFCVDDGEQEKVEMAAP